MKCRNAGIIIENPDTTAIKLMPVVYSNGNAGYELTFESGGSPFFIRDIKEFIGCLETLLPSEGPPVPPAVSRHEISTSVFKSIGDDAIRILGLQSSGKSAVSSHDVYCTSMGQKNAFGLGSVIVDIVGKVLSISEKEGV
jgi:hypothetical protein